jgi:hypothetical protein
VATSSTLVTLDDGRTVDLNSAYRRLSDANLAISGGSLSQLAHRRRTEDLSGRLTKDWINEDTEYDDTSDDVGESDGERRGRPKTARKAARSTPALSLMGAIEDEREWAGGRGRGCLAGRGGCLAGRRDCLAGRRACLAGRRACPILTPSSDRHRGGQRGAPAVRVQVAL